METPRASSSPPPDRLSAEELRELEDRHHDGTVPRRGTLVITGGRGCWIEDATGRRYLDLTAAQGVAILGHRHPGWTAAVRDQCDRLVACPQSLRNDRRAPLLAALAHRLPPGLDRLTLVNSGAEAVEAALKLARLATGRRKLVAVRGGFHGRTAGALSLTWERRFREPFEPLLGDVAHVPLDDLDRLDRTVDDGTAALVLEVVQGEGGVRVAGEGFLRAARRLCRDRGCLLVVDEVQTGAGRTGRFLAAEHFGLEPDLVTLGKGLAGGLPVGAVAFGERVAPALFPGAHGSTFGGGPVVCAAALATLAALEEERLVERAATMGALLRNRLDEALRGRPLVREVRGLGLMLGIALRCRVAPLLRRLAEEHGVLALPAGPSVLRLLPPLILGEDEIELAVAAIGEVLR